jgi:hypothetical protein
MIRGGAALCLGMGGVRFARQGVKLKDRINIQSFIKAG